MSKLDVKAMLQAAKDHRESHLTKVEVDEFSGPDEPPVTVFAKRPSISDRSAILNASRDADTGHVDQHESALRTVIRLSRDEDEKRLFTVENAQFMRLNVDADVIEALAYRLNAGLSYEAAKKNSNTTPSSDTD